MVNGKGRNMGLDTISVIVPVYRVETRLHRCVDSILAQTYRDLEVILIDDGSPDRSGDICDEYANIRSNPFLRSGRWRNTLFHISPSCWYWVMRAGKKAKYYLWLLRKKAQKSKK